MKKYFRIVLLLLLIISGCKTNDIKVNKISMLEAIELMEKQDDYVIVDVRTKEEYESGHIEGAINLDNEDIQKGIFDLLDDKDKTYYLYCRSGNRSNKAANKLIESGYTNIYDMGGISDWPLELVKE